MTPRVTYFEIGAEDPARASKFYSDAFGWTFEKWDGPMEYWSITTGPDSEKGINGGLYVQGKNPESVIKAAANAYVCTITIDDLDTYTKKVLDCGAQTIIPKQEIPGQGWFAQFTDTEGNKFGLMQMTEK